MEDSILESHSKDTAFSFEERWNWPNFLLVWAGYIRSSYCVCFFQRFDSGFPTPTLSVTLNCLLFFGYHSRRQLQQVSRWGPEPRRPRMALTGEEPLDIVTRTENRHI